MEDVNYNIESELLNIKFDQFMIEIENTKKMRKKINQLFTKELEKKLEDILILNEDQFLSNLENSVLEILSQIYSEKCKYNEKLQDLITNGLNLIKFDYQKKYKFFTESWNKNCKRGYKQFIPNTLLLSSYRKHCPECDEFASHNCKSFPTKFIMLKEDENQKTNYVICLYCKKIYLQSFILCRCYKCKVDYYSEFLKPEEDMILLPATWSQYHCEQIANENMFCVKCNQLFYINMKSGDLFCCNRKCGYTTNSKNISWTCKICNLDFKSECRPFNPLELQIKKKIVENALLVKNKAFPKKVNCSCEIDILTTNYFHNKRCNGILYLGKLNKRDVIVCSKCEDVLDFYERFFWTCPKCGHTFKEKEKKFHNSNRSSTTYKFLYPKIKNDDSIKNINIKTNTLHSSTNNSGYFNIRKRKYTQEKNNTIDVNKKINETSIISRSRDEKKDILDKKYSRRKLYSSITSLNNNESNNDDNNKNEDDIIKSPYIQKISSNEISKNNSTNFDDRSSGESNYRNKKNLVFEEPQKYYFKPINLYEKKKYDKLYSSSFFENEKDFSDCKLAESKNEFDLKKLFVNKSKKSENTKLTKYYHKKLPTIEVLTNSFKIIDIPKEEAINEKKYISFYQNERNSNLNLRFNKTKTIDNENNTDAYSNRYRRRILNKNKDELIQNNENENKIKKSNSIQKKIKNNIENNKVQFFIKKIVIKNENINKEDRYCSVDKMNIDNLKQKIFLAEKKIDIRNDRIKYIISKSKIPTFEVDDYIFKKKIGEGSSGLIYMVHHKDDKSKKFAVKKIIASNFETLEEYAKEFELVHKCAHKNVLKIFGINIKLMEKTTFYLYILMELAQIDWGKDIFHRSKIKQKYSENELIKILYQIVDALLFMQNNFRISHRDIKPQNILIFEDNIFKLADFGEAKKVKICNKSNSLKGTELYMSPILYCCLKREEDDVEHNPYKSDVFSLGLCLFYAATINFNILLSMRELKDTKSVNSLINAQLKNYYSEKLIEIITHMLEIDENKRYDFSQIMWYIRNNYD